MGIYQFDNVEVVRDEKSETVTGRMGCGIPRHGKRAVKSAYTKLWKLLLTSTGKGKAVSYEEYRDSDGKLRCRGSITD